MTKDYIYEQLKKDNIRINDSSMIYINSNCRYLIILTDKVYVYIYKIEKDFISKKFSSKMFNDIISNFTENEKYICFGTYYSFIVFNKENDLGEIRTATSIIMSKMTNSINEQYRLNITSDIDKYLYFISPKNILIYYKNDVVNVLDLNNNIGKIFKINNYINTLWKINDELFASNGAILDTENRNLIPLFIADSLNKTLDFIIKI